MEECMPAPKETQTREWPREKLRRAGPESLTNAELLAIVLGNGSRRKNVMALADEVVERLATLEEPPTLDTFLAIEGVGPGKGCQILASLEFSRRFLLSRRRLRIRHPKDALPVLGALRSSSQENFVVVTLDGNNQVIKVHPVTVGLANQSQIHPRETFHVAIADRAVSILIAHNHPSGNLEPSESDLAATRRLSEVSRTVGIPILDHLIVCESGVLSLRERFPNCF
jgi:DNA repair protein RadC